MTIEEMRLLIHQLGDRISNDDVDRLIELMKLSVAVEQVSRLQDISETLKDIHRVICNDYNQR